MNNKEKKTRIFSRTLEIPSCVLSMEDVQKIYEVMQNKANEAKDIEWRYWQEEIKDKDRLLAIENELKDAFDVSITITGFNGERVHSSSSDIFNMPDLPSDIRQIYIDTSVAFRALAKFDPRVHCKLFLDFSRTKPIDFRSMPSNPTENESQLTVSGEDETWVSAVFSKVHELLIRRGSSRNWIHSAHSYDIFLLFLFLPASFWFTYRSDQFLAYIVPDLYEVIRIAILVYIFFFTGNAFRAVFVYTRWCFPKIELDTKYTTTAQKHRKFWYSITVALAIMIVTDVARVILL